MTEGLQKKVDRAIMAFNEACGWLCIYPWYQEVLDQFIKQMRKIMTREEAKKAAEVIVMNAYADGKNIEFKEFKDEKWRSLIHKKDNFLCFNFNQFEYRIKKEPTYRPFKDKEECWEEIQKHQPFGWVMAREAFRQVITIGRNYIYFAGITLDYNEAFDEVKFADGTPFGIKRE